MLDIVSKTLQKLFGSKSEKDIKSVQPIVNKIHEEYKKLTNLDNDQLRALSDELRAKIRSAVGTEESKIEELKTESEENLQLSIIEKEKLYDEIDQLEKSVTSKIEEVLNDILPTAFALFKETSKRFTEEDVVWVTANENDRELASQKENVVLEGDKAGYKTSWLAAGSEVNWNMIHYDVQLIGGIVLHQGKIAEMQTGEGKTLVATLPMFLNALAGKGVHLVTVNDYLARRDSEWNAPLFEFHGITVDCIDKHQPSTDERKAAYNADITYGTNNEFGFDYLRDNMASSPEDLVQRKHNYAIVDEVDSVLIDDARTPLIISGPTPKGDVHMFDELKPKVEILSSNQRQLVNRLLAEAKKTLNKTEADFASKKEYSEAIDAASIALLRAHRGLPKNKALIKFLSEPGIKQQLQKTENFYLQDQGKKMPEIDKELYFVIDEKLNSVELTEKGIEAITTSTEDSNFFVLPDVATGLNAINKSSASDEEKLSEKEALIEDYSIKSERVHTIDKLLKAYCMFEKDVEYVIMDNKVKIVDEQTGRIMEGRRYSDGLHQAIEAKERVTIEASTQTYATVTLQNYFRMYNKLSGMTGTAETEAGELWEIYKLDVVIIPTNRPIARLDDNDLVYKTGREKYNAIIDEVVRLRDQERPVLVGTTSVEISELLSRMLKMRGIKHQVLNAKMHQQEAEIVTTAGQQGMVTIATNMAGRGTDIKLSDQTKDAGGLAIIGTERHESRRVDRQLRGRAGRQGDPGSSQFFVSLEDNLMRLFGSERIASMMDRMGHKEGEVIQAGMISKSIERAQKKVEENHFGTRKRLLDYDDVMNQQREVIYKRRKHALFGERLSTDIANALYDLSEMVVNNNSAGKDFENFKLELLGTLLIESPVSEAEYAKTNDNDLTEMVYDKALKSYQFKSKQLSSVVLPVVKKVHEDPNANFVNMVVPFSDGKKTIQIAANIEKSYNSEGKEVIETLERSIMLAMIDSNWKEHLRNMDDLRQQVQYASHEQKDPLLVYKFESFELFNTMLNKINNEVISFLIKATLPQVQPEAGAQQIQQQQPDASQLHAKKEEIPSAASTGGQPQYNDPSANQPKPKPQPIKSDKQYSRNDKVTVVNRMTGEKKELKFKQAEALILTGQWFIEQ